MVKLIQVSVIEIVTKLQSSHLESHESQRLHRVDAHFECHALDVRQNESHW